LFLVLILTGLTNLLTRGIPIESLWNPAFWNSGFGTRLASKLMLFALVFIISGIHDFYAGPKAARLMDQHPSAPETLRFRKFTSWAGRINFLLGLLILYYAIRLARG
jgi:hypothetical protein